MTLMKYCPIYPRNRYTVFFSVSGAFYSFTIDSVLKLLLVGALVGCDRNSELRTSIFNLPRIPVCLILWVSRAFHTMVFVISSPKSSDFRLLAIDEGTPHWQDKWQSTTLEEQSQGLLIAWTGQLSLMYYMAVLGGTSCGRPGISKSHDSFLFCFEACSLLLPQHTEPSLERWWTFPQILVGANWKNLAASRRLIIHFGTSITWL